MRIDRGTMLMAVALAAGMTGWTGPAGAAVELVVEGFERLSEVPVEGGALAAVQEGQGVTEGKQAAQVPPGATIRVTLSGKEWPDKAWLRLDTLAVQPLPYSLRLDFQGPHRVVRLVAHLQPGKDTVAVPMSLAVGRRARRGGEREDVPDLLLHLTNLSSAGVILDNLRLAAAAEAPAGSVLADFGPSGHQTWPGFRSADDASDVVEWRGEYSVRAGSNECPDPLTGSYVGFATLSRSEGTFTLSTPTQAPAVAWLWVTHYGYDRSPPVEHAIRLGSNVLLHRRLTPRQFLGPEGLLAGLGGAWTPEWFDTQYAGQFVDLVQVALPSGRSRFDVLNCQLAALAIVPASSRNELKTYVDQVLKDLSRFRRQFVVGRRAEPVSQFQATEEETRNGLAIFRPPADEGFSATYRPNEAHRASVLRGLAVPDGLVVLPAVFVPLKAATSASVSVSALRLEGPRVSSLDRADVGAQFLQSLPTVVDGRVEWQPFVTAPTCGPLKERQVVHLAVVVRVPSQSLPGLYKGTLRVSCSAGAGSIPVEVEVADVAPAGPAESPTIGLLTGANVGEGYLALTDTLSSAQQDTLTGAIRKCLFSNGLNALMLYCPHLDHRSLEVRDTQFIAALRNCPIDMAEGRMLFNVGYVMVGLVEDAGAPPSSGKYSAGVRAVVARTLELAVRARLRSAGVYLGRAYDVETLKSLSYAMTAAQAGRGQPCVLTSSALTAGLADEEFQTLLGGYTGVIFLGEEAEVAGQVARWTKAEDKRAYLRAYAPDPYMIGFYARAVGAAGAYLEGAFGEPGPYGGFRLTGRQLLVVNADGSLAPTLSLLRVRQAKGDYLLMARAEALLAQAGRAKVPADELDKALQDIKAHALRQQGLSFDRVRQRSWSVSPAQLETWRDSLIRAMAAVSARMAPATRPATRPAAQPAKS